ncbi:MAG TPA: phosphatase PAP2 family protein [Thermoanaerobaculia bacterium]|jgi:membrane-associated phospholipid phosphatase
MTQRQVLYAGGAFAVATLLCIFLVDGVVAVAAQSFSREFLKGVGAFMHGLELAFLFPLSKWASGAVLLLAAVIAVPFRRNLAWALLFVGLSQLTTRLVAGVLKNVFNRPRPFEALADGVWSDAFFTTGSAFPSGHAAHFWGFYFALVLLWPRGRWMLLILPVLASAARVVVNDHYVSDVVASAAIAAIVTLGLAKLFRGFFTKRAAANRAPSPHDEWRDGTA